MTQHTYPRETSRAAAPIQLAGSAPKARVIGGGAAARFVKNLGVQDWMIAIYYGLVVFALCIGSGPNRAACIQRVVVHFSLFFSAIVITRGGLLRHGSFANNMLYRLTVFLAVFLSYFQMRDIL